MDCVGTASIHANICPASGPIYTFGGTYIDVWDLDENWPDEYLGTISFPETNIAVSCDSYYLTCYGESGWTASSSHPNMFWSDLKISLDAFVGAP